MDVFYYWKDYAADVKALRIGRFRSVKERLAELQADCPSYIWAFKTPKGRKGHLQLMAKLVWSDKPLVTFTAAPSDSHMLYDPNHPESVWFSDSESEAAVVDVTNWVKSHFPTAVSSNFQGVNGQRAMRGGVITELVSLSKGFETRQFQVAAFPKD